MDVEGYIRETVHRLYYGYDINCACTTLICLSHLLSMPVPEEVLHCAAGMHGAGGYRAQCCLVEGALMAIGLYGASKGHDRGWISQACYGFAESFEKEFSSLRCRELRPGGFSASDPPHLCENLTCRAIAFSYRYITSISSR